MSYGQQLAVAQTAEAAGYGAFFRSDHFLTELGVTRAYLQILDIDDLDHVEYAAAELIPRLDTP